MERRFKLGHIDSAYERFKCDYCQVRAYYDCRTKYGPWAYMCEACFKKHGIGLGLGIGQKIKIEEAV